MKDTDKVAAEVDSPQEKARFITMSGVIFPWTRIEISGAITLSGLNRPNLIEKLQSVFPVSCQGSYRYLRRNAICPYAVYKIVKDTLLENLTVQPEPEKFQHKFFNYLRGNSGHE